MVERLHAVLHPRRSQPDCLQAVHRAAFVGGEQKLHFADAGADREERQIPEHSVLARPQSVFGRVFRVHTQSGQLLCSDN